MRKVIFTINITLDGCCDHTKHVPDEEVYEYYTRLLRDEAGLLVYGRKTYQLIPFWPEVAKNQSKTKASNEFALAFDFLNKIIFSRSLGSAEDKHTKIVRTNPRDEILKLKQEQGKNILIAVSASLHNLQSLDWLMNIVLSLRQSLLAKGDGCWKVLASPRNYN